MGDVDFAVHGINSVYITNLSKESEIASVATTQFRTSLPSPDNDVIINTTFPTGAGQALVTTSATTATWQSVAAGLVASVSGTANRITSSGGANPVIDISASYVGQSSITTLGTIVSGVWNGTTIAIANGGTGATTALAAINGLSPLTTKGDLLAYTGTNNTRLPVGADGLFLVADSTQTTGLRWTSDAGDVTSVSGTANRVTSTGGATPVIDISASYVGQNSITTLGTITTGTWNGSIISAPFGGTGQIVYSIGDILYANTALSLARLADVAVGSALLSGGTNTAPSWGQVNLTTTVTGTLPAGNGGTGSQFVQFSGPNTSIKTFTLPNVSDTVAVLGQNQTFIGVNTFDSGSLVHAGATSGTTVVNATAIASGVLTLPAATDTLVAKATTDTLTNKTLTGATNTIAASQLRTTGSDVVVTSTAPSGAGQVLVTTSTTAATWQNLVNTTSATATASATTASNSDVLVTGMTVTPAAGTYYVSFSGSFSNDTALTTTTVSVYVNAVQVADSVRTFTPTTAATETEVIHTQATAAVVHGSQTIEIRWNGCWS